MQIARLAARRKASHMHQRMKRAVIAAACALIGAAAFGQGTVNFANFPGNPIRYDPSVPGKNGANVEVGLFTVALYWAPLNSPESQLTQIGASVRIDPIAGFFLG